MRNSIVIETRDSSGKLRERARINEFPATLGRAFSNSVIVDDLQVCPMHLSVTLSESGEILLRDLSSVNGTFLLPKGERIKETTVAPGGAVRIGSTVLRFYPSDFAVAPTLPAGHGESRLQAELSKPAVAALLFLLYLVLSMSWNYWFDSAPDASGQELRGILAQVIVLLVLIVPWVGLWAIVGGISLHRSNIATHLSIISIFLFFAKSFYIIADYAYFAFASFMISSGILIISAGTLLFALFFLHLLSATTKSRHSAGRLSALITLCILGTIVLGVYADSMSFSDDIPFEASLKPPAFKLVRSSSVEQFLSASEKLRPELDAAAQSR